MCRVCGTKRRLEENDQTETHDGAEDQDEQQRYAERIAQIDGPSTTKAIRNAETLVLGVSSGEVEDVVVNVAAPALPVVLFILIQQSLVLQLLLQGHGENSDNGQLQHNKDKYLRKNDDLVFAGNRMLRIDLALR